MSCPQTLAGLASDCSGSMGGIVEVLIANFDDVTTKTVTDGKISAITMATGTGSTTAKFKKYAVRRETCSMTSTLNSDPKQNTKYISTELVLQFNKMETAKRTEMSVLAIVEGVAIVKDANGKYWYLGYNNPILATAGSGETGTAHGDKNAYGLTFTDNSEDYPYEVDGTIISGLL